jgi:hypothetical protein
MRNITSVKYTKSSPNKVLAICSVLFGFGLLIFFTVVFGRFVTGFNILSVVVAGIGIGYLILARPTFDVCLITTAGEARALRSKDEEYTNRLVTALNKAISQQ